MKKIFLIMLLFALVLTFIYRKAIRHAREQPAGREATAQLKNNLRNGDIIFQTSRSDQSKAIQLATNSKYGHMGIIYEADGQLYVYEAVHPVKLTALKDWIKRGENNHYIVKRLKDSEDLLTPETLKKMKTLVSNSTVNPTTFILNGLTTGSIVRNLSGKSTKAR